MDLDLKADLAVLLLSALAFLEDVDFILQQAFFELLLLDLTLECKYFIDLEG